MGLSSGLAGTLRGSFASTGRRTNRAGRLSAATAATLCVRCTEHSNLATLGRCTWVHSHQSGRRP